MWAVDHLGSASQALRSSARVQVCAFPDEKRSWWNGAEPCALHINDPADIGQSVLIQVTPERFCHGSRETVSDQVVGNA